MYQVAADISAVELRKVSLTDEYELDTESLLAACDENTKLIFLCSPNNPTGNCLSKDAMLSVTKKFKGLLVVDEAYIDFAPGKTLLNELSGIPNLVILQTFSKAWGMAGIRMGMAFASTEIIQVLNKIKYPYNLNILSQQKALELLEQNEQVESWVKLLISERERIAKDLENLPFVVKVYPSDANFLLVKMHDARGIYEYLVEEGIIVRDRSKVHLCDDSLRITIGAENENNILMETLNSLI